jgi:hypothetical protein
LRQKTGQRRAYARIAAEILNPKVASPCNSHIERAACLDTATTYTAHPQSQNKRVEIIAVQVHDLSARRIR